MRVRACVWCVCVHVCACTCYVHVLSVLYATLHMCGWVGAATYFVEEGGRGMVHNGQPQPPHTLLYASPTAFTHVRVLAAVQVEKAPVVIKSGVAKADADNWKKLIEAGG